MINILGETTRIKKFDFKFIKRNVLPINIVIFLIILINLTYYMRGENIKLIIDDVKPLNDEWHFVNSDESMKLIDLPYKRKIPRNIIFRISKKLPIAFRYPTSIRIRSSMQHIIIRLDDEIIFDNELKSYQNLFHEPVASAWYLINLPADSNGSTLSMDISSDVKMMSGRINEVVYGSKGDLISELITRQPVAITFSFVMLVIGCQTGIISVVVHLDRIKRLRYLSLFALSSAIWMIAEMDIMQIITGNHYIVGSLSYIMLPIALMSFLLLIKEVALEKYNRVLNGLVLLWGIYLLISVFLQLIANIHLVNELLFFYQVIIISTVTVIGLLLYESIHYKNKVAMKYSASIIIVLITVAIDIYKFIIGDFINISDISSLGIAIFLVMIIVDTLKHVKEVILKEGYTLHLEKIAYTDVLTGGHNRSAFEKDIDAILDTNEKIRFRLIMFDLNNLKLINDQYGHNSGDRALIDFYQVLEKAFNATSKCYRIGGDEFMVIQRTILEYDYNEAQKTLKVGMAEIELDRDYLFKCAFGQGIYNYKQSFGEFKNDVDSKMYQMKRNQKSNNS